MRPIKFRGRSYNGEFYYGELQWIDNERYRKLHERKEQIITIYNGDFHVDVDPESVAQLVGYDSDGREVYEGDVLIHASGEEWIAALGSYARNKAGLATYNFKKLTLKEA